MGSPFGAEGDNLGSKAFDACVITLSAIIRHAQDPKPFFRRQISHHRQRLILWGLSLDAFEGSLDVVLNNNDTLKATVLGIFGVVGRAIISVARELKLEAGEYQTMAMLLHRMPDASVRLELVREFRDSASSSSGSSDSSQESVDVFEELHQRLELNIDGLFKLIPVLSDPAARSPVFQGLGNLTVVKQSEQPDDVVSPTTSPRSSASFFSASSAVSGSSMTSFYSLPPDDGALPESYADIPSTQESSIASMALVKLCIEQWSAVHREAAKTKSAGKSNGIIDFVENVNHGHVLENKTVTGYINDVAATFVKAVSMLDSRQLLELCWNAAEKMPTSTRLSTQGPL